MVWFWLNQAGREYEFIGLVIALGTPKATRASAATAIRSAADDAKQLIDVLGQPVDVPGRIRVPLVIAPFLSQDRLTELAAEGVSGIDLCGNGVLVSEGLFVFKTGEKNRYPRSVWLQNAYRAKSSLVGRALLIRPQFDAVKDLVAFINEKGPAKTGRRDASISFAQVSKALKQMEQDVIVSRKGGGVRLLQADALLDALVRDYEPPKIIDRWLGRCSDEVLSRVLALAESKLADPENRYVLQAYWVPGRAIGYVGEPTRTVFTDAAPPSLLEGMGDGIEEGRRFANLEILRTHSDWVYFGRAQYGGLCASDVQDYLALANGDPRQKQASQQLRARILEDLASERAVL